MATQYIMDTILLPDAPIIPGLLFRRFQGESDYPKMVAVITGSVKADQIERVATVEQIARESAHLVNCDLYQDMLFAEVGGEMIAYSGLFWLKNLEGQRIYSHWGFSLPEWRRRGIGRAMLHWCEQRLRQIAAGHPDDGPRYFQLEIVDSQIGAEALVQSEGYKPETYAAIMVRPDLEDIPEAPMPDGLEVRPALPEHYRQIWEAEHEAFRDHWGFCEDASNYEKFLAQDSFEPSLWRVAWAGDQVAGMVRSFINHNQNAEFNRLRGWTEHISVRRPWRRRGLARSLLVQSLHAVKERGMTEAALGVHLENPNGALQLYESAGFQVIKKFTIYRKPLDGSPL